MSENTKDFINTKIDCLNLGFVRLVDYMGDDAAIVQAARVSYGEGTKTYREDRGLIRYLLRNKHTSPFEMVEFKFHVKLPIFVARQWIRHRTANVNEYSGRYSEMPEEFYLPDIEQIRSQAEDNKQGRSSEFLDNATDILKSIGQSQQSSFTEYKSYINNGLARELARINLPLSSYTQWYWKIDLHNLLHFLRLRLDQHAQYEIRVFGQAIAEIIKPIVPLTYEAFEDYSLNAKSLSKIESSIIKNLINSDNISQEKFIEMGLSKREAIDLINWINLK
jgi:thymidylate synthase (FAD)